MRCVRLTFPTGWGAFPCSQINFQNFLINLSAARAPHSSNNLKWQLLNTFKVQVLLITPELCLSDLCASGDKAQHSIQAGLNQASKPLVKHVPKPLQSCKHTDLVWNIKHYFTLNWVGITFTMGATLLLGTKSAVWSKTWQWKSLLKRQSRNKAMWNAVEGAQGWFSVSPWPVLPWECTQAPYHRDPPRAGCSCRAPPSPCATAAAGSPPPAPPRRGSWRWCRPGRQGSCGRPSWTRCTRSEKWPTWFDCTTGWFPPCHNCAHRQRWTWTVWLRYKWPDSLSLSFLQIRISSRVVCVLKTQLVFRSFSVLLPGSLVIALFSEISNSNTSEH